MNNHSNKQINATAIISNSNSTKKKKTKKTPVLQDNLEELFKDTWEDSPELITESAIEPVTEPVTMSVTIPVTKPVKSVNALSQLINSRESNMESEEEFNNKFVQICEQGKFLIEEFKKRGILVNGIDETTIIKEWNDALYLSCNSNKRYLNNLIDSVLDYGYESPRQIQSITCGRIAKGGDIIVQAKAGNGKTAAFSFGAALRIDPTLNRTQVIIISPTQLLTQQISGVVKNLTSKTGIITHCYHGGVKQSMDGHIPHIIVGCPGRIIDMINRNKINMNFLKTVILDEGDDLLKQGFREQIKEIVETLAETVQICLFSATLPKGVLELCNGFMRDPAYVILPENQVITELVSQWYVKCPSLDTKDGCIVDLINENQSDTVIIFFNSCTRLEKVSNNIAQCETPIKHLCVHGKMAPEDRVKAIADFIAGKSKVLLASDMAARGLDIPSVTLVINYDIPCNNDTYVHRIGRAGRGERLGNSVTLVMTEDDKNKMSFIVQVHGLPIKALKSKKFDSNPSALKK
jgi:translation initiation factor 4A